MLESGKKIWFLVLGLTFVVINAICIAAEQFLPLLFPVVLLVLYLAIFKMELLVKIVIFIVPLSVSLSELQITGLGMDMALPTEPILFGLLILFLLKCGQKGTFDKNFIAHPITIAILINLCWVAITCIPSIRPLVSLKFLVSRIWLLATFYFIVSNLFKNRKNIELFYWLYTSGLAVVIAYTLIMHSFNGFDQESANWIMNPFFSDHTSYGAAIAFVFPFVMYKSFNKETLGSIKILLFGLFLFFTTALILSYTRAAWLSVIGAACVYLVLKFKIKWWILGIVSLFIGVFIIGMWTSINTALEGNKQDSSTNLQEHVSSMSNVSSDASNLERFNRWNSAIEMFKKRPVFGWGPGVYAFEYAPFQRSADRTIISTNSGDGGNAHSEYLGPLAESGILGSLSMLMIVLTTLYTAIRLYKRSNDDKIKSLVMISLLGLISYYLHGGLNNFLDTDKISCLFWGLTAAIVVLDIENKKLKS